ncbi:MAG: hypothetical protein EOO38_06510 [Cytophagaceae bacterium]|nr:MAG: hypothetical protein EOO38_06510 [Cytophagaceae bacterium]
MQIGNWVISPKGIEYIGGGANTFFIDSTTITKTVQEDKADPVMYEWIVKATEEDWLEEDDLYDLNFAFVYAAASTNAAFDYAIFDETLNYQYLQFEEEEEDEE